MKRRASWNDYRGLRIYMFTINKSVECPPWGTVKGNPRCRNCEDEPFVILSEIGEMVRDCLLKFPVHNPEVVILRYVIMPDHLHFVMQVKATLKHSITYLLGRMSSKLTSEYGKSGGKGPVFEPGIVDSIASSEGRLRILIEYVDENPRRYLIKRLYPQLFERNVILELDGLTLNAFGNIYLVKGGNLRVVHVRRHWSEEEFGSYKQKCLEEVRSGAVLISPFISSREKEIRDSALELGGCIVRLSARGFAERFKPAKKEFELCSRGRLLLLARSDAPLNDAKLERKDAVALNAMAERMAQEANEGRLRIRPLRRQ